MLHLLMAVLSGQRPRRFSDWSMKRGATSGWRATVVTPFAPQIRRRYASGVLCPLVGLSCYR